MTDENKYIYVRGRKIRVSDEVYKAYKKEFSLDSGFNSARSSETLIVFKSFPGKFLGRSDKRGKGMSGCCSRCAYCLDILSTWKYGTNIMVVLDLSVVISISPSSCIFFSSLKRVSREISRRTAKSCFCCKKCRA